MRSHIPMIDYLNLIFDFQNKYPYSHVGGSIGLFLHGIDLKRHLTQSYIDMTIAHYASDIEFPNMEDSSDNSDFDRSTRINLNDSFYIKMDMRYAPDEPYDLIQFDGRMYRVSKINDIIS